MAGTHETVESTPIGVKLAVWSEGQKRPEVRELSPDVSKPPQYLLLGRMYGPGAVMRFLSVDPVAKADKNMATPQRWDRYTYSLNNPIKYLDPDGRDFVAAADAQTKTMTIKVNVLLTGPAASPQTAATFQNQANKTWGSGAGSFKGKDGTSWTLKVEVTATTDPSKFSQKDRPNTMTADTSGKTEMTSGNQGTLNTKDLGSPNAAGHEVGHMIGLADQYQPTGTPGAGQPNPGQQGTLMGDPRNPAAKPSQDEAQKAGEQGEKYVAATTKKDKP